MDKLLPNEPCLCGSGLKFKKCCGLKETSPSTEKTVEGLEAEIINEKDIALVRIIFQIKNREAIQEKIKNSSQLTPTPEKTDRFFWCEKLVADPESFYFQGGEIFVGEGELIFDLLTKTRIERAKNFILQLLAEDIEYRETVEYSLDELLKAPKKLEAFFEKFPYNFYELKQKYYMEVWFHQPNFLLNGRTPLQCRNSNSGRRLLKKLNNYLSRENEASKRKGFPTFNYEPILEKLVNEPKSA